MKSPRSFWPPAIAIGFAVFSFSSARAALALVNGDFQNTAGLTDIGGGWYNGVPTGWTGRAVNYATGTAGAGNVVVNLDQASATSPSFAPFYQDLGVLDQTSTVTLTFTLLQPWGGTTVSTGVALWANGSYDNANLLATQSNLPVGTYTLTAENVPAGTPVRVGFWRSNSNAQYPGLDNVSLTVTPVPEPSTAIVAGLGLLSLGLRRRREGGAGC